MSSDSLAQPPTPRSADNPSESDELLDEEIFCPICSYNLTGNMTGRCSECGGLFSRQQLLAVMRVSGDALMPWERADELWFSERFWRTLRISFFRPREFAMAFSMQPRMSKSMSFYSICLVLIMVGALAGAGIGYWGVSLTDGTSLFRGHAIFAAPVVLVVQILLTNVVVGLFCAARYRHPDGRHHLRPWRAILEYATAHWLLVCVAPVPALLLALVDWSMFEDLLVACTISFWIGCSILWLLTLSDVVRWRSMMGSDSSGVMLRTLPLLGIAWAVGIVALFVLGEFGDDIVDLMKDLIDLVV